jgi:ABC-2 type transport system ATP-binding protein
MSIEIQNITKRYGEQLALKSVSLSVQKNELIGFLGPNGAGKSTLMKIVTGYLEADSGTVSVCGETVSSNGTEFRRKIGYLPEHNPLYPELYVREYLEMAAGFYKLKGVSARISEVMEMTGLHPEGHKKIGALSKGYRQRVGLAQALLHNPEVIILDEPTTGLDPNQLTEIRALIKTVAHDKTVILSTHIMQEVEAMCNRVVIIHKGELVADGATETIRQRSQQWAQHVFVETVQPFDVNLLQQQAFVESVEMLEPSKYVVQAKPDHDIRPLLFDFAVANSLQLLTLREESKSMENVFRELTAR